MKHVLCGLAMLAIAHSAAAAYRIDHIMVGVADLDRGVAEIAKRTGVTPAYGGKHPRGTQNALLSLGDGTYLEIIAYQPGAALVPDLPDLTRLKKPAPVGWAVSAADLSKLRAIVATTDPQPGSRVTPSGATLHWQTAGLTKAIAGAPFFIAWAPETPHPSTTSPAGCKLARFDIVSPDANELRTILQTLALNVRVSSGKKESFVLTLDCPKGRVTLRP